MNIKDEKELIKRINKLKISQRVKESLDPEGKRTDYWNTAIDWSVKVVKNFIKEQNK